jgi:hypothetical protein
MKIKALLPSRDEHGEYMVTNNYPRFPKPIRDSGVGIHFGNCTVANLERWLPDLKALHMKWVVLASESEEDIGRVSARLLQEGIMPIARPQKRINCGADFGILARRCGTPYVQIYNEPGIDATAWRKGEIPKNYQEIHLNKWIAQAYKVRAAGYKAGLQIGDPAELYDFLIEMKRRGDDSLWPDMWLALHLYPPLTKPPLHPNPPYICTPDCTEHYFAPQGFRPFAAACEAVIGYPLKMAVTEGGYDDGQGTPERRAKWMVQIYELFKTGEAPDYLLAWCPFILAAPMWHGFSWLTNERHQEMVRAVKEMGSWERGKPVPYMPPEPKDWRVVSPYLAEDEALEDLATLDIIGFPDYRMERR